MVTCSLLRMRESCFLPTTLKLEDVFSTGIFSECAEESGIASQSPHGDI
jgi:hypothetical protein